MPGSSQADPGVDAVWAVERALAAPPYGPIRVGAFVNDLLIALQNEARPHAGRDVARVLRDLTRTEEHTDRPADLAGQILMTWIDGSPRFADLVLPVVEELGARATVLVARPELPDRVPAPSVTVDESQVAGVARRIWWAQFRRAAPSWATSMRQLVRRGHLPAAAVPGLVHLLVVQTQRFERYRRHFQMDRPDAVLVEYDRGTFAAPIVAAAGSLGIPTATMVHGSVHPHGYTPLLADVALCWGTAQAAQMEAAGAPAERLAIAGCQRLGLEQWSKGKARADLGLDDRPVIVLATNNLLAPAERLRLARLAFEATATLGDTVQLGLRIHPRETLDDYRELLDSRADLHLLGGDRATGDQVLAACDLVLCGVTAFADEAMIAGVPTMIIDLSGHDDITVGLGADGPLATSRAELAILLDRWARDDTERAALEQRAIRRGRELCAAVGRPAARLVADEVRALADRGRR
jgi:hypothetical protein